MPEPIGGQAVIEGVLICSSSKVAVSVRKENGSIKKRVEQRKHYIKKFSKIPFLRGLITLFDMLFIGTKALSWSSNEQLEEDEQIGNWGIFFTIFLSFALAIGLFIFFPLWLSKLITEERVLFNIIDGILRILIFLAYLLLISRFKDIQRIFQYHGAEHMSIHCHDANKPLSVKNVQQYSPIHPRCGTSFIFIVLVVSIIAFSFIWSEHWWMKFLHRIVLIPVIAMVSYEILKFADKHPKNILLKALTMPGLWFQKITTAQPDKKQIEVAISSVKAAR